MRYLESVISFSWLGPGGGIQRILTAQVGLFESRPGTQK